MPPPAPKISKHVAIYESLRQAILSGERRAGERLPSEHELVLQFATSRPTVARAMRDLQHAGLIERRAGSGTFVRIAPPVRSDRKLFGLLIPDLGRTEVFEPICAQIARQTQAHGDSLLWGDVGETTEPALDAQASPRSVVDTAGDLAGRLDRAEQACRGYIEQGVAGVYFAPVEYVPHRSDANQPILAALDQAKIPVVLLDRDTMRFPHRSRYDLISIDNARGSYLLTEHLIQHGRRRICFVARPHSAPTVDRRIAGYREAMWNAGLTVTRAGVQIGDPSDAAFVRGLIKHARPEALICANDITAAHLMRSLHGLGLRVPEDLAVVGFDDVKYAQLLGVPLTTVRQPCRELGAAAVSAMRERLAQPDLPPRTILLEPSLVVRQSCGAL